MDNRDGAHALAAWVRQPEVTAVTVAVIGLNLLVASLFAPIGLVNIVLSALGAGCIVAGVLTLVLHLAGRAVRLDRRAERVVTEGRGAVLLPGLRPPQMYRRSHQPAAAAKVDVSADAAGAVIDITDELQDATATVPTPAVPEQTRARSPRAGTAVG